ncbi:hypothetical protein ACIQXI_00210 [Lysinibacillus sp. NPDC097195]|uniref:hypothetical protein n=1 Tax=Lysinibacillus sp. NPDC097195 TaxID=3364141 RepID=UPI00381F5182
MTSFKNKLDKELGEAPRFTKALQERIVHSAEQQQHKQNRHWQYPAMIVGAIVTLLFLFVVGPLQQTVYPQHASIVELAQNEQIQQLSIASNRNEYSFKAGRTGWVIGQQEYGKGEEAKLIENVLQHGVVAHKNDDYHVINNMWVEFGNGQSVKITLYRNMQQLAFLDVKTNTFYKVNDEQAVTAFTDFIFKVVEFSPRGFIAMMVILVLILFGAWVVERAVRWKFNIPKEPKYVTDKHQKTAIILKFFSFIVLAIFNLKQWIIFIAADFVLILVSMLTLIATEYYFGRHEKRHYVAITNAVYLLIVFIAFVIWFNN